MSEDEVGNILVEGIKVRCQGVRESIDQVPFSASAVHLIVLYSLVTFYAKVGVLLFLGFYQTLIAAISEDGVQNRQI